MKSFFLFAIIFSFNTAFSQTLFFDNPGNSTWISKYESEPSKIFDADAFGLSKLLYSKDSIDRNVSIWSFADSTLTISNYDYQLKMESKLLTYPYSSIPDRAILVIMIPDSSPLSFSAGIVSTGHYAILTKVKKKKSRV